MNSEIVWNAQTLTIVLIFSIPLATILGGLWFKAQTTKSEHELKQAMVQRGMSADEIERVLAAKGSGSRSRDSAGV